MDSFKNAVFDIPEKPITAFKLYYKERVTSLKQKYNNNTNIELITILAKDWEKDENEQIAKKDRDRFKRQLKEFAKLGYYIKDNMNEIDEEDSKERKEDEENPKEGKENKVIV